ncbi:metallophosphoesterase [Sphingomonas jaspsi]|uniref:metallophosphoesterase n=1 Tax=Sphingomonas jaspsi TaxID=392409 RepID=UPI0004B212A2|nr:metallophosphoesterase [Sphingomonas jaspsi]
MEVETPSGVTVWLIGDPHLGRKFETGVPLDRRGEREARQLQKFKDELATDCDINIMVGDLFDHPQVSLTTILEATDAYLNAAQNNPKRTYVAMAGNHDRSRQLGSIGAWELFRRLIGDDHPNIWVVDKPTFIDCGDYEQIACVPWQWGKPVVEQIEAMGESEHVPLVVLHHDLESFGGDDTYLVPAQLIRELFPNARIITGHWHLEGDYKLGGVEVTCTGSLEPYTHAEDPNGDLYVTLTVEELAAADPADLRDKAVRVLLRDGDELPIGLDCLQLTGKRISELENDEPSVADKLGTFDWKAILDEHLKEVPGYVREFIDERLHPA